MEKHDINKTLASISFPSCNFIYSSNDNQLTLSWERSDSKFPHRNITLLQCVNVPDDIKSASGLFMFVRSKILWYLEHEMDETLSLNGTFPNHPHLDLAHEKALEDVKC